MTIGDRAANGFFGRQGARALRRPWPRDGCVRAARHERQCNEPIVFASKPARGSVHAVGDDETMAVRVFSAYRSTPDWKRPGFKLPSSGGLREQRKCHGSWT